MEVKKAAFLKKTNLNCLNKQLLNIFKLWCEWGIVRFLLYVFLL